MLDNTICEIGTRNAGRRNVTQADATGCREIEDTVDDVVCDYDRPCFVLYDGDGKAFCKAVAHPVEMTCASVYGRSDGQGHTQDDRVVPLERALFRLDACVSIHGDGTGHAVLVIATIVTEDVV